MNAERDMADESDGGPETRPLAMAFSAGGLRPAPETALVIDALYEVVAGRRGGNPEKSYTARLFAKGRGKICEKFGEEAVETIVAGMQGDSAAVVSESADIMYHLVVLWADMEVRPERVWEELARRFGTSGIDEKSARKKAPKPE